MAGNKTISFSVSSVKHKEYLQKIAIDKGYGKVSNMARLALEQMLSRKKIPFLPDDSSHGL